MKRKLLLLISAICVSVSAQNKESQKSVEVKIEASTNKKEEKVTSKEKDSTKTYGKYLSLSVGSKEVEKDSLEFKNKRTSMQFVFSAGLNNLMTNDKISGSDFRYWGSHFYEWGVTGNTRIFKNDNLLHLKYGMSLIYDNLRPTDNRYFETDFDETILIEELDLDLKESRFRNVYLVLPMHLEFDFSGNKLASDGRNFKTHKSVRFGIGGFAGIRIKSKQVLCFEEDGFVNNVRIRGDYNVNDFNYGLSSYLGYRETSVYVKYNLNHLFENNPIGQHNISLGLRFDLN